MFNILYESVSYKNTKADDKPNEDLIVYDEAEKIGLLIDGVSRDKENGHYPVPSPAVVASEEFAKKMVSSFRESKLKGLEKLKLSVEKANDNVKKYNEILNHRFPAGTVGICFAIEQDSFIYGYIGDCYAAIIRNGTKRTFTECQTQMVATHKKEFTSDEIRFHICNNISHPCGYGVWDGNPNAMDFTKYGEIRILPGDAIIIYSDGLEADVQKWDVNSLAHVTLRELFGSNTGANQDDRSCLRIRINK